MVSDRSEPGHCPPPSPQKYGVTFRLQHSSVAVSPGNSSTTFNCQTPLRLVPAAGSRLERGLEGRKEPMKGAVPEAIELLASSSKVVAKAGEQPAPKLTPKPPSNNVNAFVMPSGLMSDMFNPSSVSAWA